MSGLVWTSIQRRPELPEVFRSGDLRDGLMHIGASSPATVFLTKPFTFDQLQAAVSAVLSD